MNPVSPYDPQIDATLRFLGAAQPPAGLSDRVASRMANERYSARARWASSWRFPLILRFAASGLAASACAVAIVIGTVQQSNRIAVAPPAVRTPASGGIGAAGAEHVPTKATPQAGGVSGRNVRRTRHGRAVVSADAHKAPGVALPKPADQP
jgi:hypothetical protein